MTVNQAKQANSRQRGASCTRNQEIQKKRVQTEKTQDSMLLGHFVHLSTEDPYETNYSQFN
uniref:Uncharacterized protein n=1 Tax=Nelumbo nucifera TaxID=4432 RepID=A0A822XFY7_NELNU|nr:TPA_asm: hypothetical protein HUJ06_020066 [Nelumbo nucifera]